MLHLVDDHEDVGSPTDSSRTFADSVLAELVAEKTRRWAYLRVARWARLPHAKKRKRGQRAELMLSHAEFRLLFALVERADTDLTNSFPRVETLAAQEGWSIKMVKTTLRSLAEKGWLVRHGEGGAKVNQFCVPSGAINRYARGWEGPVKSLKRGVTKVPPLGVTKVPPSW